MGLINYTSLALKLQKEVESQVGGPVNPNTIVVAIKRYADSFEKKEDMQNDTVLKNARLSLTDRIVDIKSFSEHRNFFQTGMAKITINIPESEHSSDVVSYVSEILHDNGIELFNAFFAQDHIVAVLHEKDAARAYQILRREISR